MGGWVGGREIDWDFVHEEFKTWEMVLCEALAGVVPWAEQAIVYHFFGLKAGKRREVVVVGGVVGAQGRACVRVPQQ